MTISYSDFLKEGALPKQELPSQTLGAEEKQQVFRLIPEDIPNETESKAFWKRLRHYYRTGERPEGRNGVLVPALIAPFLRNGNWDTEYPYYLAQESATSQSLERLIASTVDGCFAKDEAKVLRLNLSRLVRFMHLEITNGIVDFQEVKDSGFKRFMALEIAGEEAESFKADAAILADALPNKGHLLDFHHELPLHLVRQKLQQIEWNRNKYKERIKDKRMALEQMLQINDEKLGKEEADKGFEFATDMIALDKVQEMSPRHGSSRIEETRLKRIQELIEVLISVENSDEHHAQMIVVDNIKDRYNWEGIFTWSKLSFVPLADSFKQAKGHFDRSISEFTKALVAMRKADLELDNKYNEEVHNDFFDHFKWFKLDPEELNIFPPVMIFADSNDLLDEGMAAYSRLMTTNRPIKVVALKDQTFNPTNPDIDWEDASLGYRQELMAHALSHRNVHVLQCATDRPDGLLNGIRSGMNSIAPSLMHLLVKREEDEKDISFLKINAAAAGRFFPYLCYDPHLGVQWGSRFDVNDNSQPAKDWPVYPFTFEEADGQNTTLELAFTYADYKAMNQHKVQELFIVPEAMVTEYLIPLSQFIGLDQQGQAGKVPFIWLVDEEDVMVRAAVPYMWVSSCLERLEFWNFIQEIGGVRNYHANQIINAERKKLEEEMEARMRKLKAEQDAVVDTARQESVGQAMHRLAATLLELDLAGTGVPPARIPASKPQPASKEVSKVVENEEVAPTPQAEASSDSDEVEEAYVETDRCTSCNDCTERYPAIFDYNEEKQAFVKDASKGTFEHLVMAAENCPAACIHPGTPLNPNEPNLEELKARAAKFN